jgi:hypothetical protein
VNGSYETVFEQALARVRHPTPISCRFGSTAKALPRRYSHALCGASSHRYVTATCATGCAWNEPCLRGPLRAHRLLPPWCAPASTALKPGPHGRRARAAPRCLEAQPPAPSGRGMLRLYAPMRGSHACRDARARRRRLCHHGGRAVARAPRLRAHALPCHLRTALALTLVLTACAGRKLAAAACSCAASVRRQARPLYTVRRPAQYRVAQLACARVLARAAPRVRRLP